MLTPNTIVVGLRGVEPTQRSAGRCSKPRRAVHARLRRLKAGRRTTAGGASPRRVFQSTNHSTKARQAVLETGVGLEPDALAQLGHVRGRRTHVAGLHRQEFQPSPRDPGGRQHRPRTRAPLTGR
jgi:hypothetical protein